MINSGAKAFFARLFSGAEFDPSRRRVIKGAAGLAALAVVSSSGVLRPLNRSEIDRLHEAVSSGVVADQTFYLDRTAVFQNLRGVTFLRCNFIAAPGFVGDYLFELNGSIDDVVIYSCNFDARAIGPIAGGVLIKSPKMEPPLFPNRVS